MNKYKITLSDGSQRTVEADGYDQYNGCTQFYTTSQYTMQWNDRQGIWPFRYNVPMSRIADKYDYFLQFNNHVVNVIEVLP